MMRGDDNYVPVAKFLKKFPPRKESSSNPPRESQTTATIQSGRRSGIVEKVDKFHADRRKSMGMSKKGDNNGKMSWEDKKEPSKMKEKPKPREKSISKDKSDRKKSSDSDATPRTPKIKKVNSVRNWQLNLTVIFVY